MTYFFSSRFQQRFLFGQLAMATFLFMACSGSSDETAPSNVVQTEPPGTTTEASPPLIEECHDCTLDAAIDDSEDEETCENGATEILRVAVNNGSCEKSRTCSSSQWPEFSAMDSCTNLICSEYYVPNSDQTECMSCEQGYEPNSDSTACVEKAKCSDGETELRSFDVDYGSCEKTRTCTNSEWPDWESVSSCSTLTCSSGYHAEDGQCITDVQTDVPTTISTQIQISAGDDHTLYLDQNGDVWAWGSNKKGQLGISSIKNKVLSPTKIESLKNIVAISTQNDHSLALDQDGHVWSWGWNKYGQLGHGNTSNSSIPVQIKDFTNIKSIHAGYATSQAIDQEGHVWAWGRNKYGGISSVKKKKQSKVKTPTLINEVENIISVTSGIFDGTVALGADGTLWNWGGKYLKSGKIAKYSDYNIKFIDSGMDNYAIDESNYYWSWGSGPTKHSNRLLFATPFSHGAYYNDEDEKIGDEIRSGGDHTLFLEKNGDVWSWGNNAKGQAGLGYFYGTSAPKMTFDCSREVCAYVSGKKIKALKGKNIVGLSAGSDTSFALDSEGHLYGWGNNHKGQLGLGEGAKKKISTPTVIEFPN